jgi:thiamine-phosphate pyrophosphorylase
MKLRGLYVVTPPNPAPGQDLVELVAAAVAGGARIVQYRNKTGLGERKREARQLLAICRAHDVPLIVNDDLELAGEIGADGVHLGQDDAAPQAARERLGMAAIIGVSCHNRLDLALRAQAAGASYVAFGSFYPSATKPLAVTAAPDLLRQARNQVRLPLVAIGGITPENGAALIAAGADMLAVINGVFAQPDIRSAAQAFTRLFPSEVSADDSIR